MCWHIVCLVLVDQRPFLHLLQWHLVQLVKILLCQACPLLVHLVLQVYLVEQDLLVQEFVQVEELRLLGL